MTIQNEWQRRGRASVDLILGVNEGPTGSRFAATGTRTNSSKSNLEDQLWEEHDFVIASLAAILKGAVATKLGWPQPTER